MTVGRLQVARCCTSSSATRRCPGSGSTRPRSGPAFEAILRRPRPRATASCSPAATSCSARSTSYHPANARPAGRPGGVRGVPARDRLPRRRAGRLRDRAPRTSTPRWPRSPARSWWCRCSTRGSPRTPPTPAGARCTTRSTAPTRSRGRRARSAGTSYNPARGAEVIARGRAFLDAHFPLTNGSHATPASTPSTTSACTSRSTTGTARLADPKQYVGHRGAPDAPEAVLLVHHGLHVEIQVDRDHQIGQRRPGRRQGPAARVGGLHDHGPRGLGRRGRRRGQGRRLPQLARGSCEGTLSAEVAKGGEDVHPPARAGPHLRRGRRTSR